MDKAIFLNEKDLMELSKQKPFEDISRDDFRGRGMSNEVERNGLVFYYDGRINKSKVLKNRYGYNDDLTISDFSNQVGMYLHNTGFVFNSRKQKQEKVLELSKILAENSSLNEKQSLIVLSNKINIPCAYFKAIEMSNRGFDVTYILDVLAYTE